VWERLVALTPAFLVACSLLVLAGAAKLLRPAGARSALGAAGVPVPSTLVRMLGILEAAVGGWGACDPSAYSGAVVAVTYAGFCWFLVTARQRGADLHDCGCLGGAQTRPGALHLGLNVIACVVAALVAAAPSHGLPWILTRSPLVSCTLIVGTAGAVFAAYVAYAVVPEAWRAYGAGGNA
jgi:hypothetical protein